MEPGGRGSTLGEAELADNEGDRGEAEDRLGGNIGCKGGLGVETRRGEGVGCGPGVTTPEEDAGRGGGPSGKGKDEEDAKDGGPTDMRAGGGTEIRGAGLGEEALEETETGTGDNNTGRTGRAGDGDGRLAEGRVRGGGAALGEFTEGVGGPGLNTGVEEDEAPLTGLTGAEAGDDAVGVGGGAGRDPRIERILLAMPWHNRQRPERGPS